MLAQTPAGDHRLLAGRERVHVALLDLAPYPQAGKIGNERDRLGIDESRTVSFALQDLQDGAIERCRVLGYRCRFRPMVDSWMADLCTYWRRFVTERR